LIGDIWSMFLNKIKNIIKVFTKERNGALRKMTQEK
jgi:hypothetical protein